MMKTIKDLKGEIFLIHAKNRNMKSGKCILIGIPTEMYKSRNYRKLFGMINTMPSICCTSFGIDDDIDYIVTLCCYEFAQDLKFQTPVHITERCNQCTEDSKLIIRNGALCVENCITLDPDKIPQGYIGGNLKIFNGAERDSDGIELITPPAYRNGLSQQKLTPSDKPLLEESQPLVRVIRRVYNNIEEVADVFVAKRAEYWLRRGYKISQWNDTPAFGKLVTTVILVKEDIK